jgi:hypothetical protein
MSLAHACTSGLFRARSCSSALAHTSVRKTTSSSSGDALTSDSSQAGFSRCRSATSRNLAISASPLPGRAWSRVCWAKRSIGRSYQSRSALQRVGTIRVEAPPSPSGPEGPERPSVGERERAPVRRRLVPGVNAHVDDAAEALEKVDRRSRVEILCHDLPCHDVDDLEPPGRSRRGRLEPLRSFRRQDRRGSRRGLLQHLLERNHLRSRALRLGVEDPDLSHRHIDYRSPWPVRDRLATAVRARADRPSPERSNRIPAAGAGIDCPRWSSVVLSSMG